MKRRAFFHCVVVFLLLIAQQGAMLHAVWHAYAGQHERASVQATAHQNGSGSPSNQAGLCAFDVAFGQMLGFTHSGGVVLAYMPVAGVRTHDITAPRLHAEVLSPKSRGPPVLA